MKRFLILVLILALCLSGCKRKQTDIPGGSEAPEGVDWKLWEDYTPVSLFMGEEMVDVLIAMDAIHLAVYYDREEQELLGSITIPTPLTDVDYSRERLRIEDHNGDGYDDICIPDMLQNGDRTMNWWLWDRGEKAYRYAPEDAELQEDIGGDISWQEGKPFISATMDTPDGPQDLLILVEGQQITVYLDQREEVIWGTVQTPKPLSAEAQEHLAIYTYWDCRDLNGDGWGDLQVPCRWEESADGSVTQYCYCWRWNPVTGSYDYDMTASGSPTI